jgi:hypothetical protein
MNSVPSRVEVMLSGNALAPASAIDNDLASAVVIQRTDENTALAITFCLRRDANEGQELIINMPGLKSKVS